MRVPQAVRRGQGNFLTLRAPRVVQYQAGGYAQGTAVGAGWQTGYPLDPSVVGVNANNRVSFLLQRMHDYVWPALPRPAGGTALTAYNKPWGSGPPRKFLVGPRKNCSLTWDRTPLSSINPVTAWYSREAGPAQSDGLGVWSANAPLHLAVGLHYDGIRTVTIGTASYDLVMMTPASGSNYTTGSIFYDVVQVGTMSVTLYWPSNIGTTPAPAAAVAALTPGSLGRWYSTIFGSPLAVGTNTLVSTYSPDSAGTVAPGFLLNDSPLPGMTARELVPLVGVEKWYLYGNLNIA